MCLESYFFENPNLQGYIFYECKNGRKLNTLIPDFEKDLKS